MNLIIYEPSKTNGYSKCIKVGMLGCKKIESISEGVDDNGLEIYSYKAHYNDGRKIKIENALFASS